MLASDHFLKVPPIRFLSLAAIGYVSYILSLLSLYTDSRDPGKPPQEI